MLPRVAIYCKKQSVMRDLITLCNTKLRCVPAAFKDFREFSKYSTRGKVALGIIDATSEPHEAMAIAWDLRNKSVHTPLIAISGGDTNCTEDDFYTSGFNAVIAQQSPPLIYEKVMTNFFRHGLISGNFVSPR